jgi:hypothetical protein
MLRKCPTDNICKVEFRILLIFYALRAIMRISRREQNRGRKYFADMRDCPAGKDMRGNIAYLTARGATHTSMIFLPIYHPCRDAFLRHCERSEASHTGLLRSSQ